MLTLQSFRCINGSTITHHLKRPTFSNQECWKSTLMITATCLHMQRCYVSHDWSAAYIFVNEIFLRLIILTNSFLTGFDMIEILYSDWDWPFIFPSFSCFNLVKTSFQSSLDKIYVNVDLTSWPPPTHTTGIPFYLKIFCNYFPANCLWLYIEPFINQCNNANWEKKILQLFIISCSVLFPPFSPLPSTSPTPPFLCPCLAVFLTGFS